MKIAYVICIFCISDIYIFLEDGLQTEVLSSSNLTQREKLLTQLINFQKEYPELHLSFKWRNDGNKSDLPHRPASTHVSYVDMNGGSPYKLAANQPNGKQKNIFLFCIFGICA